MSVASRQPAWQVASARNCNRSYCRIISARSENHPSQGFSQANAGQGVRVFVCVLSAIYCGSSLHHHLAVPGPVPLGQVSPSQRRREGACAVGSRRLPAVLRFDHRSQDKRCPRGPILLHFGPTTIAAIYKDRWEIELFFKALKQNLKVKSFVGTSRNALLIQIWTALIAMLLLKWLHHLSKAKWSFSNPGLHAAFESVHLPGSAAVAGESLRHPAACPTNRTAYPESELIRTGNDNYRRISGHEWGAIGLASCPPQQ